MVGIRRRGVAHSVGQSVIGHHRVAEVVGHLLGRARPSGVGGPDLLHHEHVGIEVGTLCAQVIGTTPAVHPEVDVEGGEGQRLHGQPRTEGLTGAGFMEAAACEGASGRRGREWSSVSSAYPDRCASG